MLLGIRFTKIKKNRYNAPCPFHADIQDNFMVYVNMDTTADRSISDEKICFQGIPVIL